MNTIETKIFIPEIPAHWKNRIRSGHTNIWNEGSTDWTYPEVRINPPANGLYAKSFEDGWYWVNGCETCLTGVKTDSYIVCDEHNRCADCGTHRDGLTTIPHGSPRGFVCAPCYETERVKLRNMAIERAKNVDHSEDDCIELNEIICPVCAEQIDNDDGVDDGDEKTCPTCNAAFQVQISIKYSTILIRKEEIS